MEGCFPATISAITLPITGPALMPKCELPKEQNALSQRGALSSTGKPSGKLGRLPAQVTLIPIQNGFDHALDARGEFVEGIASFVSECDPGRTHTRITRRGRLHVGPRGQAAQSHPEAAMHVVSLLRALAHAGAELVGGEIAAHLEGLIGDLAAARSATLGALTVAGLLEARAEAGLTSSVIADPA